MPQAAFNLLEHSLLPMSEFLTQQAAECIVQMNASEEAQNRIDELAEKCNEGLLTADKHAQYEMFVWIGQYISGMQAKARRVLAAA